VLVRATAGRPTVGERCHRATARLLAVGTLFAAGTTTAGLVLGRLLVAACGVVTATTLCLRSEALAWWERRTSAKEPVTT
jgi:hypothetical protein